MKKFRMTCVTLVLCGLGAGSSAYAVSPADLPQVAGNLSFPQFRPASARLVVSGAGEVVERDFRSGEAIAVDLGGLPDGRYRYELRISDLAVGSSEVVVPVGTAIDANGRPLGSYADVSAPTGRTIAGRFFIQNGVASLPLDLPESAPLGGQ
ncbi:hypothetical protein [Sinimarinibacterium flocculans]|uniref:hypothetical protein n=1 Tax=Sinimarinibacterium flocculans TaxID=985250 RepID=UPI00351264FE